jgi:hypothetical protein
MRRVLLSLAAVLAAAGCSGSGSSEDWGPLAVIRDEGAGGAQVDGGSGTLRISEDCVVLTPRDGREVTLVWPSGLTAWEPEAREVVFESFEGDVRVADGDTITVGGSGDIAGDWVAAPAASCPERRFLVYELRRAL